MRNEKQETIHGGRPSTTPASSGRRGIGLVCLVLATAVMSRAQDEQAFPHAVTFKTLVNFDLTNGGNPIGYLVQGVDGNFYSTTYYGGANNGGTVFKITPSGTLTTLYSFCSQSGCNDGANPGYSALAQTTDGTFYGTTLAGGAHNGSGTAFKMTPNGTLTTIYSFCALTHCADGGLPFGGLVRATDGNFYGTTVGGGSKNAGVVFKITPVALPRNSRNHFRRGRSRGCRKPE